MKIDIFGHIIPPAYATAAETRTERVKYLTRAIPTHSDMDARFKIMDKYPGFVQVLTLASPPLEAIFKAEDTAEFARIANDAMAELVNRYPDRFIGAAAILPMCDMDAALRETDRAINDLKFSGVYIYTPNNGRPLDHEDFMPLYEKMSQYGLPIWIHPWRDHTVPDYPGESESKYMISGMWGWPYESTVAMTRLVFSGILDKYPDLKFIIHHCGAMVPFLEQRIVNWYGMTDTCLNLEYKAGLAKSLPEYFRMFYVDTAINGSTPGLMCGYAFYGAEHMLFGTDMPFDCELGERSIRETIVSVEGMEIPEQEKQMIFEDNAKKLLRLP